MKTRSKIATRLREKTPASILLFTSKYAELVIKINVSLHEKNWSQKTLAEKLGKNQSEISKWLSGAHNLTLMSICKIEAELGISLIEIVPTNLNSAKTIQGQIFILKNKLNSINEKKLVFEKSVFEVTEENSNQIAA